MNFEDRLKRIEEIVGLIESEKTDFETSIKLYEESAKLIKECFELLKNGSGKIKEINEELNVVDFKLD